METISDKPKRKRNPTYWKSIRVGLNQSDHKKLERYATLRKITKATTLRQLVRKFAEFEFTEDMVKKVNAVFELIYGFSHQDLNLKSSQRKYTDYRHAHRYWLKVYTKLTLREIGEISNNADYSTVKHSISEYPKIYNQFSHLRDNHDKFKQLMA